MNTNLIMTIFDLIVFLYGCHCIFGAFKMERTGTPDTWFVPVEELLRIEDREAFSTQLAKPTGIFGGTACIYAVSELANQYVLHKSWVRPVAVCCFVAAYFGYMLWLNRMKQRFLPKEEEGNGGDGAV